MFALGQMQNFTRLILVILACSAGGCATAPYEPPPPVAEYPLPFAPGKVDARESVSVHLLFPQTEPKLFKRAPYYFGQTAVVLTAGLAGAFNVLSYLGSTSDEQAAEMIKPLAGYNLSSDITGRAKIMLRHSVERSTWMKPVDIAFDPVADLNASIAKASLLQIELADGLSFDGSMFVAEASVGYWRRTGEGEPVSYGFRFVYCSAPIEADTVKAGIDLWAADKGARYRAAEEAAIAEICRTVEDYLLSPPPPPAIPAPILKEVPLRIIDPFSGTAETMGYFELQREGERLRLYDRMNGLMYSAVPLPAK